MRQLFWCSLQIAVFGSSVYWMTRPEMLDHGGNNPYAVTAMALILTMAATAAVMIARDLLFFVWRRLPWTLREANEPDYRPGRIGPATGGRHPGKLPPGGGVRKQIR